MNSNILFNLILLIFILTNQNKLDIVRIPFTRRNIDSTINSDCYDVCYSNNGYCLEFYNKVNGLEVNCGHGESKKYTDKIITNKQYSKLGDLCICIISNNIKKYNNDIFQCTPDNYCEYDDECIRTRFNAYIDIDNYIDNLKKCIK